MSEKSNIQKMLYSLLNKTKRSRSRVYQHFLSLDNLID